MRSPFLRLIAIAGVGLLFGSWEDLEAGQLSGATPKPGDKPYVQAGQTPNGTPIPKTMWGQPDLSGIYVKRPAGNGGNSARGVEPLPFTPEGLKAFNNIANEIDPQGKCIFPGVPRVVNAPYPMQVVQTPDYVIFLYEFMHNFRIIPTDGRKHPDFVLPTLMGHSVGRWEGDTFIVDTVGLRGDTWLDDHGNVHSDALHVTEKYRRVSADQLWFEFTIDDPKYYTRPWSNSYIFPLAPPDWEIAEYACTDFNPSLEGGHQGPGPIDGSLRDGTAIAPPAPRPR